MYKVKCEIETIVPYKQDPFLEEAKERADKGKTSKGDTYEKRQKQWEKKVYKDDKGCYVPVSHIYHSLLNGLAGSPQLVSNKVKMTRNVTKATVFLEETKMYIYNGKIKTTYDRLDVFHVRTRLCGMQANAHTVFEPPCKISFTIVVTQDFLLPEVLKEGLARAGQCYGIGAGHPIYGRFVVNKFEVLDN